MKICPKCHNVITEDTESVNNFFCHCPATPKKNLFKEEVDLKKCECGTVPNLIAHFITGTANRVHYFIRCPQCKIRTRNRRQFENAVEDWNNDIKFK